MIKNIYLGLVCAYLIFLPVSVFESGLPQPADMLMAFLIVVLLTGFIIRAPVHMDIWLVAALFVGYVAIVNLYWWSHEETNAFLLSAMYYAFNFGAFMVMVSLAREFRGRFVTACQIALAIAIVFEIGALLMLPAAYSNRHVGTFNNPNQLGYWALLIGCCLLVLKGDRRLNLIDVALLSGVAYAVAMSLSKAALLSFVLLLLLALVFQRLVRPVKIALLALVVVSTTIAFADNSLVDRLLSHGIVANVADRIEGIGQQADDSLSGRGYDRIWRYPEYLVLGAGEGAVWRFSRSRINPRLDQREMHSTFGTVLFSYGIVGFTLFLVLLWVVFRSAPLPHMLYSLPIWAYGMTHQGLRDTMLWVFLGLVFGLAQYGRPRILDDARRPPADAQVGLLATPRDARLRTVAARMSGR